MGAFRLDRLLDFLTSIELVVALLWLGLAVFTATLIVMMHTRWGQSRPLRKCIVLSLLAHMLLAGYTTTVHIVGTAPGADEPAIRVSLVEGPSQQQAAAEQQVAEINPWEELPHDAVVPPRPDDPQRPQPKDQPQPQRQDRTQPTDLPSDPSLDHMRLVEVLPPEPQPTTTTGSAGRSTPGKAAEAIDAPPPRRRDATPMEVPSAAPGRNPAAAAARSAPARTGNVSLPSALFEQSVSLPRLASPPTTPEPASALAALTDQLSRPGRSKPARAIASDLDSSVAGAGEARGPNESATGTQTGRLFEPSIDTMGRKHQDAAADSPGSPPHTKAVGEPKITRDRHKVAERQLPKIYQMRVAPDRSRLAERKGATSETEAAVKAALKWLAANQSSDGHWDVRRMGAGRELMVAGHNRQSAGMRAETGISGLALLAFLASGHTHRQGPYRENVRRGLEYLLRAQAPDGNLGGRAGTYARMYCHAMAAFALSEAYGMTGDERLRAPVRRAMQYTIAAQSPVTGGWRYTPHDPGDTSQLGWQLMALKSAELAGIPTPTKVRNGIIRYLQRVSSGKHGGLASYRPNERISRPMTAEALVCWQFLGLPRKHPACNEAGDYLLAELPGDGKANLYYWYYATLAMYQLQGTHWERWNERLRETLIASQRKTGPMAGTWDPNTVWGGYGGRAYSTAMAALCLEVYYRFLPLYVEAAAEPPAK